MVPKPRRPPRLSGGGLDGPKAKEAPSPQRWGPRWSQSQERPPVAAAGASVIPKRKRPPRLSGGGLGDPKAAEAPSPQRREPRCSQSKPTGRPYPSAAQAQPEGLGCNRRCVGEGPHRAPTIPHGASLSLRGLGKTGGTRVQPPLCGGGQFVCPKSPTERPHPSPAQAGPEGLGCNRRCVGEGPHRVPTILHGAPLSLRGPGRTGGTRVQPPLCGGGQLCPKSPTERPYPSAAQAGPEGLGCNRRCVGEGPHRVPTIPTGRPYPSAAQARPEGLGCNRRCVGEGPLQVPTNPHGASLSLRGPSRTGGTRV